MKFKDGKGWIVYLNRRGWYRHNLELCFLLLPLV